MKHNLTIAVASGKGGTGKTTIAANLAYSIGYNVRLLDCDVEEPNSHIFLKPEIVSREKIGVPVPEIDESKCNYCGECGRICVFSAIVPLKDSIITFPELCHGCGGCSLVCPEKAIKEIDRETGVLEIGWSDKIEFVQGRLNIGEAMSPPLIRAVKKHVKKDGITIIDAPPGTSCPVIESVKDSDYVVLVTEPTPFGLNDLKLAVGMVRELGIPFGVVVNRATIGDRCMDSYCLKENIKILLKIPDKRKIAEAYSRGELAVNAFPEYKYIFEELFSLISGEILEETEYKL